MAGSGRPPRRRAAPAPPQTPDGRYLVVRGRLWRASNPALSPQVRQAHVDALQAARRAVRQAGGEPQATAAARRAVQTAKEALGERGPVWWQDGAPDWGRYLVKNTPYADWYRGLAAEDV